MESPIISYGVYRNNADFKSDFDAELNYSSLVNNLFREFDWIATPQYFENSTETAKYNLSQESPREILFLDWFIRLCRDFIVTKNEFLLVLQDCIWLPDSFVINLRQLMEGWPRNAEALTLLTNVNDEMEFEADDYIEVSSFDNLAFVISKRTAVRLLSLSNAEPHKSWSEFFLESVIRTFSCSPKSKARVYVFKDIWGSQNTYQHQLSISDFSPNVCDTPDSNVISNSNVHAFVSHWHSTWDNVCSVQAACEEFGYKTDILNSTEIQINGWINDVPIEYFGQIEAACQAFDENHDFLLFIQADHKTTFWTDYFAHVSPYLNFATTGTIAPTVTNNLFRRSLFPKATFNRRDHLSVFPNNDINVIYIRKEIVLKLRDFFSFFHATQNWKPSLGAGVVDLMNHICSDLDLVHLRDYCYSFMNPFSRGWSEGGANELMPLLKIATNFMGNSVESVVNNFDKVSGNYYHPNKF